MQRNEKVIWLEQNNIPLYRDDFNPNIDIQKLLTNESLPNESEEVLFKVAGRIMLKRVIGSIVFITIQQEGSRIQCMMKAKALNTHYWQLINKGCDIGDVIGVEGYLGFSHSHELTLKLKQLFLLAKSLEVWPDKYHGLKSTEEIYRKRYLSLCTDLDIFHVFQLRFKAIAEIRKFYTNHNFLEVETPILHSVASGAAAKPFVTHHNSLNMKLYLRVAPELYLKRLQIGGLGKIFEINRNFRNEGLSTRHNPEFTMLESYEAYSNFQKSMDFVENLIEHLLKTLNIPERNILHKTFKRVRLLDVTAEFLNLSSEDINSWQRLAQIAQSYNLQDVPQDLGNLQTLIFDEIVSTQLREPTFVTHYPRITSPLALSNKDDKNLVDRAELFVNGIEIANMYSELNDPEEQLERFDEQEAMMQDYEYIEALRYGMPPCAGIGIGIDRLIMLLSDVKSIREVILFPQMRLIKNSE